nr:unnamed protein product [Digitaria exilis]
MRTTRRITAAQPTTLLAFISPPLTMLQFQIPLPLVSFLSVAWTAVSLEIVNCLIVVLVEQEARHKGISYQRPATERVEVDHGVLDKEMRYVHLREGTRRQRVRPAKARVSSSAGWHGSTMSSSSRHGMAEWPRAHADGGRSDAP